MNALSPSERAEMLAVLDAAAQIEWTGAIDVRRAAARLAARLRIAEARWNPPEPAQEEVPLERKIAHEIELAVQFKDFGHFNDDGDFVANGVQVYALQAACRAAASAVLSALPPAGDTVVQEGLIRLANDLRIDPWVRKEIIELLEPIPDWHHPVGLTMKNATAGDTVAVKRETLETLAKRMFKTLIVDDSHEELRAAWEEYHEAATRLLEGRQP